MSRRDPGTTGTCLCSPCGKAYQPCTDLPVCCSPGGGQGVGAGAGGAVTGPRAPAPSPGALAAPAPGSRRWQSLSHGGRAPIMQARCYLLVAVGGRNVSHSFSLSAVRGGLFRKLTQDFGSQLLPGAAWPLQGPRGRGPGLG